MGKRISVSIGQSFNSFTVTSLSFVDDKKFSYARFRCVCGSEKIRQVSSVTTGKVKCCGCLNLKAGGLSTTTLYTVWATMKRRCDPLVGRKYYASRGIYVCEQWKDDFNAFKEWAISNGHQKGLHIDRIDNNGPYSPENCRFVTFQQNMNNRSCTRKIIYKGKEYAFTDLLRGLGIINKYSLVYARIYPSIKTNNTVEDIIDSYLTTSS